MPRIKKPARIRMGVAALACSLIYSTFASSTQASSTQASLNHGSSASITQTDCAPIKTTGAAVPLLGPSLNNLNGWSHIAPERPELEGLQQPPSAYAVNLQPQQDTSCESLPIINALLVKKYHNWEQQHLSGLEANFPQEPIALGRIKQIQLLLRINSNGTHIPTPETYHKAYAPQLSASQLAELDNQTLTLELTLFDPQHANQNIPSLKGTYYLSLKPRDVLDQWLRVAIPVNAFDFSFEKNWKQTSVYPEQYARHKLAGLRINPETTSGKVVRHYLEDGDHQNIPKLYKEIHLSLGDIVLEHQE